MGLYQLGPLQFTVFPLALIEVARRAEADFAWHDVVGAQRPPEPVGEGHDEVSLRIALHPHRFGGLSELEALHAIRRSQEPQILVRGDGTSEGWRVTTEISERGTYLDLDGVGRCIEVTVALKACPPPSRGQQFSLFNAVVGTLAGLIG